MWFDGANGGSGYYGGANESRSIDSSIYYDFPKAFKMIKELQPNCAIWGWGQDWIRRLDKNPASQLFRHQSKHNLLAYNHPLLLLQS